MLGGIGATELMIILVLVLILFGAGRLPQVFESFGKGMKAFREAQKDEAIDVSAKPIPPKEIPADELADAHEVKEKHKDRAAG